MLSFVLSFHSAAFTTISIVLAPPIMSSIMRKIPQCWKHHFHGSSIWTIFYFYITVYWLEAPHFAVGQHRWLPSHWSVRMCITGNVQRFSSRVKLWHFRSSCSFERLQMKRKKQSKGMSQKWIYDYTREENEQFVSDIFFHTLSGLVKVSSVPPWQAAGVWGVSLLSKIQHFIIWGYLQLRLHVF